METSEKTDPVNPFRDPGAKRQFAMLIEAYRRRDKLLFTRDGKPQRGNSPASNFWAGHDGVEGGLFRPKDPGYRRSASYVFYRAGQACRELAADENPTPLWKEFGGEALHGTYWVCGTYPEHDIDADDYGRTIGTHTGNSIPFVALVEIDFEPGPGGEMEVFAVNRNVTGAFEDDYGITHYAAFVTPVHPGSPC